MVLHTIWGYIPGGMLEHLLWSIFLVGVSLFSVGGFIAGIFSTSENPLEETGLVAFAMKALIVGFFLAIPGIVGVGVFTYQVKDFDFSREYGQLVRNRIALVSFDQSRVPANGHVNGRIILCNEDGTRYRHLDYSRIPERLQSYNHTDVSQIIFIREERWPSGNYGSISGFSNTFQGTAVALTASVLDISSGRVVAITRIVGEPPDYASDKSHATGDESANNDLYTWIVNGK
jgi:hypothetical protein